MLIKIIDNAPTKYTFEQLRKEYPNVVFTDPPRKEDLVDFDAFIFNETTKPTFDIFTQKLVEETPILVDGEYQQVWSVVQLTEAEKADIMDKTVAEVQENRRKAYQKYADPLYFLWQRGESTQEEYLNMIETVKQTFPYPQGYVSS